MGSREMKTAFRYVLFTLNFESLLYCRAISEAKDPMLVLKIKSVG